MEYGRSAHSDARKRLVTMGEAWCGRPGAPIIFPGEAEQQAAYRFLSNPRIGMRDILEPHQEAMRCRSQSVVLAVQDTTMLNYSEATQGLVDIGGSGSKGLMSALRSAAAHWGYSALIPCGGQGNGGRGKRTDAFAKSAELACPQTRSSATVRATCGLFCRRPPRPAAPGPRQPFGRAITADGKVRDLFAAELDVVAEKTIDLWRPPDAQGAQEHQAGAAGRSRRPRPALGTAPLTMLAVRVLEKTPPTGPAGCS